MHKNIKIDIHHITRVEGHGNIVIDIKKGVIKKLRLEIVESPRFFEVMLRGRKYDEAQHIMSRICGICAVSHTSASLKAIEDAMGITISKQATLLRKLAFHGEMLQSHILHLYFLVLPDFFRVGSIVPLAETHPDVVKRGLSQKKLEHSFEDLEATLEIFKTFRSIEYSQKREYLSLKEEGEYALYSGKIQSSQKYSAKPKDYRKLINESIVPYSTAKHTKSRKGTYMVGALARICNNFNQLSAF